MRYGAAAAARCELRTTRRRCGVAGRREGERLVPPGPSRCPGGVVLATRQGGRPPPRDLVPPNSARVELLPGRELLREPLPRAVREEDEWAALLVLVHQAAVLEPRHERVLALDPGVRDGADLLAVEATPALLVEAVEELHDALVADEVDEGVPEGFE